MGKIRKNKQTLDETPIPLFLNTKTNEGTCVSIDGAFFSGAVFNLSTTVVGTGIMALPATMKILGLVPGILMLVTVAFLTEASIEMLIKFSRAAGATSYGGVMGDAFGRTGRMLLEASVVVNIGILVVYMIIIGDVLSGTSSSGVHHSGVLESWFGAHWWNSRFFVLLLTTLVVFAPLASLKSLDSLRYTSTLSVALALVFVVITAAIAVFKSVNGSIETPRLLPVITDFASVWDLFTAVPVIVTAFICHYNVHSINNELKDSSLIQPIVRTSLSLCCTIYISTSLFAYLLFRDSTLDDVLANFDSDLGIPYNSLINDIVRVSYVLHLMLVFPVIFFPLRLNFDGLFFSSTSRQLACDSRRFVLENVLLLSVIFMASNFIPSIWDVFQFLGATTTACIAFIFPAAIALRDPHRVATKWDKILSITLIILAVAANGIATYSDAYSIFHTHKNYPPDR